MARPSKRLVLSGQRFLTLRMERAVAHGDIHADEDSPRAQSVSMMVGVVLAVVTLAGAAALAVWRPSDELGDATVMTVRDTGALYVRVQDVVHPVLNLTSARLIAATGESPRQVSGSALARAKRGPTLGIPGAPTTIGTPLPESAWTVCDDGETTVIAGPPAASAAVAGAAVLAAGPSGTPYLLYNGSRARVDLTNPVVLRVLRLEGHQPVPVSRALLDLVPELPPITPPPIPGVGTPGPAALPGFLIGEVVRVQQVTGTEFFVVLAGGVQQVTEVAADLIRHSGPSAAVTALAPALINQLPRLGALAVQSFPERLGTIGGADGGAVCASWTAGTVEILLGARPRSPGRVRLAQADGAGPLTDAVDLPAGRSAYVRAEATSASVGSLVTEYGVRFPVGDEESARILGLPATPAAAPRAVLEALPLGPELTRSAALTAHDAVAAP